MANRKSRPSWASSQTIDGAGIVQRLNSASAGTDCTTLVEVATRMTGVQPVQPLLVPCTQQPLLWH